MSEVIVGGHIKKTEELAFKWAQRSEEFYSRAINAAIGSIVIHSNESVAEVRQIMVNTVIAFCAAVVGSTYQSTSKELEDAICETLRANFAAQREMIAREQAATVATKYAVVATSTNKN